TLSYGEHDVALRLTRNDVAFASAAASANQQALAKVLDMLSAGASGDLKTLLDILFTLSEEEAQEAFDQLSGETLAAFPAVRFAGYARFSAAVGTRTQVPGGAGASPF